MTSIFDNFKLIFCCYTSSHNMKLQKNNSYLFSMNLQYIVIIHNNDLLIKIFVMFPQNTNKFQFYFCNIFSHMIYKNRKHVKKQYLTVF